MVEISDLEKELSNFLIIFKAPFRSALISTPSLERYSPRLTLFPENV
jgi:hypothetical protein